MFSQTAEYALRAAVWLASRPGEPMTAAALAGCTKVPEHYLPKVLQQLVAAKLLRGQRGARGGYQLALPPEQISVISVVRAVSQAEWFAPEAEARNGHAGAPCPVHRLLQDVTGAAMERLKGRTLQDLARGVSAGAEGCAACGTCVGNGVEAARTA